MSIQPTSSFNQTWLLSLDHISRCMVFTSININLHFYTYKQTKGYTFMALSILEYIHAFELLIIPQCSQMYLSPKHTNQIANIICHFDKEWLEVQLSFITWNDKLHLFMCSILRSYLTHTFKCIHCPSRHSLSSSLHPCFLFIIQQPYSWFNITISLNHTQKKPRLSTQNIPM